MSVIDAIIAKKLCGGGGGSVPKPLTYDYMPEGYPKKAMGTVTVMAEQEVAFYDDKGSLERYGNPADPKHNRRSNLHGQLGRNRI